MIERYAGNVLSIYHVPHKRIRPVEDDSSVKDRRPLAWWYRQVNDYARRQLTLNTDRLPALSGLAKQFSERTGYHYKAGIWLEDLYRGLLWTSDSATINTAKYPSWSWSVIEGELYESTDIYDYVFRDCQGSMKAELIEISVKSLGNTPFGQVESAALRLRGICQSVYKVDRSPQAEITNTWTGSNTLCKLTKLVVGLIQVVLDGQIDDDASNEMFWERKDALLLKIARYAAQDLWNPGTLHVPWIKAT